MTLFYFLFFKLFIILSSVVLHYVVFILILKDFFGSYIKVKFNNILNSINLSCFVYLSILITSLIFVNLYMHNNIIFSDYNVIINNQTVIIKGELIRVLSDNLSQTFTFIAGARIAAMLISKHSMGFLPKWGIISLGGAGLSLQYRILSNFWPPTVNNSGEIIVAGPTQIEAKEMVKTKSESESNAFKLAFNSSQFEIKPDSLSNKNPMSLKFLLDKQEWKAGLSVTKEVEKVSVDWTKPSPLTEPDYKLNLDSFIKCPLDSNELFILEMLNNSLLLECIKICLIIILIIILLCKLLVNSKSIEIKFLNKYLLGRFINTLLFRYVNTWQKSNSVWIFLITTLLLSFSLTTLLALNRLRFLFS
nr:hypothetical protein [Paramarasmius palmivorus]